MNLFVRSLTPLLAIVLLSDMIACGGSSGSSSSTTTSSGSSSTTTSGSGITNLGGSLLASPTPVAVTANASRTSVDIQVSSGTSTINANALAITAPNASQALVAANGVSVHQGQPYWLWVNGTGVTASLTLSISGPADISQTGPPLPTQNSTGTIYPISIAADAALGARTIVLTDANNNVTTLTGAMEVCSATAPGC